MKHLWAVWGRAAAASVVMIALASPVRATITQVYGDADRATFYGSLTTIASAGFEESLSNGTYQVYGGSYNPSAVLSFLGVSPFGDFTLKRILENGQQWLVGPAWTNNGVGDPRLEITLSAAAKAFGIDIASSWPGISYRITVDGEDAPIVVAPQAPSTTFFGVRSDANITHVTIRMVSTGDLPFAGGSNGHPPFPCVGFCGPTNADESRFDNFIAGNFGGGDPPPPDPGEVPETSTLLYGAMGLSLLAWTRYRRPQMRVW